MQSQEIIPVDISRLFAGIQKLLALASTSPALNDQPPEREHNSILLALGFSSLRWTHSFEDTLRIYRRSHPELRQIYTWQSGFPKSGFPSSAS